MLSGDSAAVARSPYWKPAGIRQGERVQGYRPMRARLASPRDPTDAENQSVDGSTSLAIRDWHRATPQAHGIGAVGNQPHCQLQCGQR